MIKFMLDNERNLVNIMNKKTKKILAWIMAVIMIISAIATIIAPILAA